MNKASLSQASHALLASVLATTLASCKARSDAGALAKAESNDAFANVPSPPADGPKLVALRAVPVQERPNAEAKTLGELDLGSVVARSREPATRENCAGGWYAVRPRGFVCANASVALDEKIAGVLPPGPKLDKALPYRFGKAKTENVPIYARLPTFQEQLLAEPDLNRHLGKKPDGEPVGTGANDVPLDAKFSPMGPPVLLPTAEGVEAGRRTTTTFFSFPKDSAPPFLTGPVAAVRSGGLRKGSALPIAGVFTAESGSSARRFALTADGRAVPADRLKPALGPTWHGIDLEGVSLPVAFVHKQGVHLFSLQKGKATKLDEEVERRQAIPMSNKFRTVEGVRYEETKQGEWLRSHDVMVVVKRGKYPDFARGQQKWVDISIASQTLTAYEGQKAIYVTLVSTGRDQLKDPATSASTPRGVFRVKSKRVTAALDGREVSNGFEVTHAPYALEFENGAAIVGMYWSDGVGDASMFHSVGMTPIDAHRIWSWSDPPLPEGWRAVNDAGGSATIVNIRP